MPTALVLINPRAGRGWRPDPGDRLVRLLAQAGVDATLKHVGEVSSPDLEGVERVVLVGGDGTVHRMLPALLGRDLTVAMVPRGTGNVLARELGIPFDLKSAVRIATAGSPRTVQVGTANGIPFCLMAGAGVDAYLADRVSPPLKSILGIGAYWLTGLRRFWRCPLPAFEVRVGDEVLSATQLVVANGRQYGGGLVFAPEADISRPGFEVCLFQSRNHARYLVYLLCLQRGTHHQLPDVALRRAAEVTVEGPPSVAFQLDGEVSGNLPLRLCSGAGTLRVMAPSV